MSAKQKRSLKQSLIRVLIIKGFLMFALWWLFFSNHPPKEVKQQNFEKTLFSSTIEKVEKDQKGDAYDR